MTLEEAERHVGQYVYMASGIGVKPVAIVRDAQGVLTMKVPYDGFDRLRPWSLRESLFATIEEARRVAFPPAGSERMWQRVAAIEAAYSRDLERRTAYAARVTRATQPDIPEWQRECERLDRRATAYRRRRELIEEHITGGFGGPPPKNLRDPALDIRLSG